MKAQRSLHLREKSTKVNEERYWKTGKINDAKEKNREKDKWEEGETDKKRGMRKTGKSKGV